MRSESVQTRLPFHASILSWQFCYIPDLGADVGLEEGFKSQLYDGVKFADGVLFV